MPFDAPGRGPRDDNARLDRFKERADTADTVVWLPSPFSRDVLRALGTLIRIDFLMVRDRLDIAARHLSIADRELARALLQNQQSQLYQRVRAAVEAAFGLRTTRMGLWVKGWGRVIKLFRLIPFFSHACQRARI
jgi:hypothetical protein